MERGDCDAKLSQKEPAHWLREAQTGVSLELLGLISRAAVLTGKTRCAFVREAVQRAAIDVLTDRSLFAVDADTYVKFAAAFDGPPRFNDKLVRTMQTPAPWDALDHRRIR